MPKDYNKTISQEILVLSRIKKAVSAAVCAIRLREECEDCIQEAVVRFLQRYREVPGRPFSWYLTDCCWFVRDFLKQGRSLDSPKRRTLRQSIDSENIERVCSEIAQFVSHINPRDHAVAADDLEQMRIHLSAREFSILDLLLQGKGTHEVAQELRISASLVSYSSRRIRKIAVSIGLVRNGRGPLGDKKEKK
jgi:RNA polymerase sigma factor (sigma-70 family)